MKYYIRENGVKREMTKGEIAELKKQDKENPTVEMESNNDSNGVIEPNS